MTDLVKQELIELDEATSTVTIAGRRFPACVMLCPLNDEDEVVSDWDRALGAGSNLMTEALIPMENGVVFHVEQNLSDGRVWCRMDAVTCTLVQYVRFSDEDRDMWVPHQLGVHVCGADTHLCEGAFTVWQDCELWWVVEQVDRVSAMHVRAPPGPRCELVPLGSVQRPTHG